MSVEIQFTICYPLRHELKEGVFGDLVEGMYFQWQPDPTIRYWCLEGWSEDKSTYTFSYPKGAAGYDVGGRNGPFEGADMSAHLLEEKVWYWWPGFTCVNCSARLTDVDYLCSKCLNV